VDPNEALRRTGTDRRKLGERYLALEDEIGEAIQHVYGRGFFPLEGS
jgi:hypothetical protein